MTQTSSTHRAGDWLAADGVIDVASGVGDGGGPGADIDPGPWQGAERSTCNPTQQRPPTPPVGLREVRRRR